MVVKAELAKTPNGVVYEVKDIPGNMFEFFIHKKRTFKDGTSNWAIGVSPTADSSKGYTFETFRGTEQKAADRLDEIVEGYRKRGG